MLLHKIVLFLFLSLFLFSKFLPYSYQKFDVTADKYCPEGTYLSPFQQSQSGFGSSDIERCRSYLDRIGEVSSVNLDNVYKTVKVLVSVTGVDDNSSWCNVTYITYEFSCKNPPSTCESPYIYIEDINTTTLEKYSYCSISCPPNSTYSLQQEECICNEGYFKDSNNTCQKLNCPLTYKQMPLIAQDITAQDCLNKIGTDGIGEYVKQDGYKCCYGIVCDSNSTFDVNLNKCIPKCNDFLKIWDDNLSKCIPKCLNNKVWDENLQKCVNKDDACRYPVKVDDFYFVYTTEDEDYCNRDISLYNGGKFVKHHNCRYGACYLKNDINNNNSDLNNSDLNITSINLNSSINTQIKKSSSDIVNKLNDLKDNLGKKLDSVDGKLDNIGKTLQDINNTLNPDLTNNSELIALTDGLDGVKEAYSNIFDSFERNKNDFFSLVNSLKSPEVVFSSSDCKFCFTLFGPGNICIDLSVFSIISPFFHLFLNFILLYFSIKLYIIIARDIVGYFLGGS